jgi:Protein of unknown function (DUF3305)
LSGAAPQASIEVGVLAERRKASSPWIDYVWKPVAALAGAPAAAPWTIIEQATEATTFYAGAANIGLYRNETGNYRDNLISGTPQLWVVLRPTGVDPAYDLIAVTADPSEGEAFTEAGNDLVEPVPMPHAVRDAIAAFVAEHHVERPFVKRKRKAADPEALAQRPRNKEDDRE